MTHVILGGRNNEAQRGARYWLKPYERISSLGGDPPLNVVLKFGHMVCADFYSRGKVPTFSSRSICDDETGTMYFRPFLSIRFLILSFLIIEKLLYV